MWAIDDFTEANGGTRLVPGSHRWTDQVPDATDRGLAADLPRAACGTKAMPTARSARLIELLAVPREIVATLRELVGVQRASSVSLDHVDGRHPRRLLPD
jgi:hypothetical protein